MWLMGSVLENLTVDDDGFLRANVHRWAEEKYRLLALYDELFSSGMKNKWDQRVYIDLYAGSGFSHIQGTRTFLKGSPMIALTVACPFDKYIFCEENQDLLVALRARSERMAPQANVSYILGKCDEKIDEICGAIPKGSADNRVLSLCLVDPFDFGIKFDTLKMLSHVYVDFVVLLAIGMDANRNYDHYVEGNSPKIDEALGNTEWRERWKVAGAPRSNFRRFLAMEFSSSMESLGYRPTPLDRMRLVRSDEKNLPLYYLALFSRHDRAHKFWDQVLKYATDQSSFDFE
jgi:three-Cys-motif partner protein